jgi:hypothetical protein
MKIIGELGTTLAVSAVTSNRSTLRRNTICIVFLRSVLRLLVCSLLADFHPGDGGATFLKMPGLPRATRRHIPQVGMLRANNLSSKEICSDMQDGVKQAFCLGEDIFTI